MFKLVFKDPVYDMLDEAYWWYEEQMPGLGERLLKEIDSCFEKLAHTPFYYSIDKANYRHILLKHFPYKIIFEILDKEIIIYAVFHTSLDPNKVPD